MKPQERAARLNQIAAAAARLARRQSFRGIKINLADMEQAAWLAMLDAWPRYNPKMGNRDAWLFTAALRAAREAAADELVPFGTRPSNATARAASRRDMPLDAAAPASSERALAQAEWEAQVRAAMDAACAGNKMRGAVRDVLEGKVSSGEAAARAKVPITRVYIGRTKFAKALRADPGMRALWEERPWAE